MTQISLDLGIPTESVCLRREVAGFLQFREAEGEPWRFHVTGFDATCSGEAGQCWVLAAGGQSLPVPIDARDRLLIGGKRYGREDWDH
ncbi:hypothetical protein [Cupriavidus pauculus]|uniref:hypothetical protein n=1 Tax=Cupriavidus pauculus TaxID=82633 RepID=UPI00385747FA